VSEGVSEGVSEQSLHLIKPIKPRPATRVLLTCGWKNVPEKFSKTPKYSHPYYQKAPFDQKLKISPEAEKRKIKAKKILDNY